MSISNKDRVRTIIGRDVIRLISQREQIPISTVQSVFNCFYEIVEMGLSRGYIITIPAGLGKFVLRKSRIMKKGRIQKIQESMLDGVLRNQNKDKTREVFQDENGDYYYRYLKDSKASLSPTVKISRALKGRIMEETSKWLG